MADGIFSRKENILLCSFNKIRGNVKTIYNCRNLTSLCWKQENVSALARIWHMCVTTIKQQRIDRFDSP